MVKWSKKIWTMVVGFFLRRLYDFGRFSTPVHYYNDKFATFSFDIVKAPVYRYQRVEAGSQKEAA